MVFKAFASLVVFTGGIRTASGLLAVVPATAGENASRRHGTQVRGCLSPAGNLLAFVQHWHSWTTETVSSAGTMTLQTPSGQVTRNADYMLQDKAVSYLDGQCADGFVTDLISTCPGDDTHDDWAVFEFTVGTCSTSSSFTLQSGNTVVLTEGCSNLYPATISGSVACPTTNSPTPSPPPLPTPYPTPGWPTPHPTFPTAAPTAGGAGGVAATGDPHLQNVHGERFDLMKPGRHVLINIPRGASGEDVMLRVQADARRLGGHCADLYFQEVNVTGSWAESKQVGGHHYIVSQSAVKTPQWVAFDTVQLKVVHGHTDGGFLYLNVYVKHLGRAGYAVGGLLGEDDHTDVIIPPSGCATRVALAEGASEGTNVRSRVSSVALASFA